MPDFAIEDTVGDLVCGIDEAGRGPWAGPVVAAAVTFARARADADDALLAVIDDSKKLSAKRREAAFAMLQEAAARGRVVIGVGAASVAEIDRLRIVEATFLAMSRAVAAQSAAPAHALVDGIALPALPCPATAVPKGDGLSLSIAAASIVAKVSRDRLMAELDRVCPGYGFARHMGYGTDGHRRALAALGVTPHHRKCFAPIYKMLCAD